MDQNEKRCQRTSEFGRLKQNHDKLLEILRLACRAIERLAPKRFLGLIPMPDAAIYNHTAAKQIAGLSITQRESPLPMGHDKLLAACKAAKILLCQRNTAQALSKIEAAIAEAEKQG